MYVNLQAENISITAMHGTPAGRFWIYIMDKDAAKMLNAECASHEGTQAQALSCIRGAMGGSFDDIQTYITHVYGTPTPSERDFQRIPLPKYAQPTFCLCFRIPNDPTEDGGLIWASAVTQVLHNNTHDEEVARFLEEGKHNTTLHMTRDTYLRIW